MQSDAVSGAAAARVMQPVVVSSGRATADGNGTRRQSLAQSLHHKTAAETTPE
jgi:hypothetical protein